MGELKRGGGFFLAERRFFNFELEIFFESEFNGEN
jgi:hypothetical protein